METTMNAESLRKQAEELTAQAQKLEREAREAKDKEERATKAKAEIVLHQDVATRLVKALKIQGTEATMETYTSSMYREGFPFVKVEFSLNIAINTRTSRYAPYQILGVEVEIGSYGERPQKWQADKAEGLDYDAMVRSIQRRIIKKRDERDVWEAKQAAQKQANIIETHNQHLVEELKKLRGEAPVGLVPSRQEEGRVSLTMNVSCNAEQATAILLALREAVSAKAAS